MKQKKPSRTVTIKIPSKKKLTNSIKHTKRMINTVHALNKTQLQSLLTKRNLIAKKSKAPMKVLRDIAIGLF